MCVFMCSWQAIRILIQDRLSPEAITKASQNREVCKLKMQIFCIKSDGSSRGGDILTFMDQAPETLDPAFSIM